MLVRVAIENELLRNRFQENTSSIRVKKIKKKTFQKIQTLNYSTSEIWIRVSVV